MGRFKLNPNGQFFLWRRSYLLFLFCVLCSTVSIAQSFEWKGSLKPVDKNGFYEILLSPEIIAKAKSPDLFDIRLTEGEKEVSYVLRTKPLAYDETKLTPFNSIQKTETPKQFTSVIFANENAAKLDEFSIVVNNTSVLKVASISGSNDKTQWYSVNNSISLDPQEASFTKSGTELIYTIAVPTTNYQFYKLEINDSLSAPLFIKNIGRFNTSIINNSDYDQVPSPVITKVKSSNSHQTVLRLTFKEPFLIRKLLFDVAAPKFFKREAILALKNDKVHRHKKQSTIEYLPVSSFSLVSGAIQEVTLDKPVKESSVYLVIENEDNQPLAFKQIEAFQQRYYLTAYLEKDKNYNLNFGNPTINSAPQYDLSYFTDKINGNLPALKVDEIKPIEKAAETKESVFFTSKNWIWTGLILLVGILVLISFKMIREMKDK
ncbi:hypothetical protein NF867_01435 [Solitalea sp. MAHUQ-68]|uniref:DUF3999 domain-containing protein n=1 Tax=Solitalea agri TaxID=2953739 RepID=A0A9X2EYU4_9SPHI|nr:hypothetical protein [Solitalea agri]MCO4291524.1 hypothetical protein [Solitalea agri]